MRAISSNIWKKISDTEYIAGLKSGNNHITESFFYGLCNYLLNDIRFSLMDGHVDYDELVNELFYSFTYQQIIGTSWIPSRV